MSLKNTIILLLSISLIVLCLFFFICCKSSEDLEYIPFTVNEGQEKFSFEYPSSFNKLDIDYSSESNSLVVKTSGAMKSESIKYRYLFIYVEPRNEKNPSANEALNNQLSQTKTRLDDFQLLDRSIIMVAGVQGEQIIYSYYGYHQIVESAKEIGTAYEAYFDCNDMVWRIEMIANESSEREEDKADFEHIVETFIILD